MTMTLVRNPFEYFADTAGRALNGGEIFIGLPGQDPETNPTATYWDAAGTIPAVQPISTIGGYPMRAGSPAKIFVDGQYSIRVRDRFGVQVFYDQTSSYQDNSAEIVYQLDAPESVARSVASKLAETVSILDFGGAADYETIFVGTNNTDAANRAIRYLRNLPAGGTLFIPDGRYRTSGSWDLDRSADVGFAPVSIKGQSRAGVQIWHDSANALLNIVGNSTITVSYQTFSDMTLIGYGGIAGTGISAKLLPFCRFENLFVEGFADSGLYEDADHLLFDNCIYRFNVRGNYHFKKAVPTPNSTQPNIISYRQCTFGTQGGYGLKSVGGSCLGIDGGSFEGNNSDVVAGNMALTVISPGYEGGVALSLNNVYFEQNHGDADVYLEALTPNANLSEATYSIRACSFSRVNANYATNFIRTAWDTVANVGRQVLSLDACCFKSAGTYTPNAARPYLAFTALAPTSDNFFERACIYEDAVETPTFVGKGNMPWVIASKNGSTAVANAAVVAWDLDTIGDNWGWTAPLSGGGIGIPVDGLYAVNVFHQYTSGPAGHKRVTITVNGIAVGNGCSADNQDATTATFLGPLLLGDLVKAVPYQSTGGAMTMAGSATSKTAIKLQRVA